MPKRTPFGPPMDLSMLSARSLDLEGKKPQVVAEFRALCRDDANVHENQKVGVRTDSSYLGDSFDFFAGHQMRPYFL